MGNESRSDVISSSKSSSCSSSSIAKHSIFSCLFSRTVVFHLSTFSAFLSSSASHQRPLPSLLPRSFAPSISDSKRSLGGAPHSRAVPISFPCPILTPPPLPSPCRSASDPACSSRANRMAKRRQTWTQSAGGIRGIDVRRGRFLQISGFRVRINSACEMSKRCRGGAGFGCRLLIPEAQAAARA
jgi:hypothetical protein